VRRSSGSQRDLDELVIEADVAEQHEYDVTFEDGHVEGCTDQLPRRRLVRGMAEGR
jgi:hypothetical protein